MIIGGSHIGETANIGDIEIIPSSKPNLVKMKGKTEFSTIQDYVFPQYAKPQIKNREVIGEILHIDNFGNIISNISKEVLEKIGVNYGDFIDITLGDKSLNLILYSTYSDVQIGKPLAIIGSHDYLEVAINQSNASRIFKKEIGETFKVSIFCDA